MVWEYNNAYFSSIHYNWEEFKYNELPTDCVKKCSNDKFSEILVYVPKYDKCYWLSSIRYSGNGNRLKAYLTDIYSNRHMYLEAKWVELVIQIG